jgi:hypothetical protein
MEQEGHKWRHNMAHTRCLLDKQDCVSARDREPTRARKYTEEYVIPIFHGNNYSRTRLNVTLHVHCMFY